MSSDAKVVITGVGMVTSLGITASDTMTSIRDGRNPNLVTLPELAGTPLESMEVAMLPEMDIPSLVGNRRMIKYMSDAAVLGCIAAREAMETSGAADRVGPERIGLYASTGLASADIQNSNAMIDASIDETGNFSCRLFGTDGLAATNPLLSFKILANMPPCIISIIQNIKGPNYIFTPWEGQTAAALMEAWHAVASGEVDAALVGSADTSALPSSLTYLAQNGYLQNDEFPASGAAYMVLERADRVSPDTSYARISAMSLSPCDTAISDPLAQRIGHTYAASPAISLGLDAMLIKDAARDVIESSIQGIDHQKFTYRLESVK